MEEDKKDTWKLTYTSECWKPGTDNKEGYIILGILQKKIFKHYHKVKRDSDF